jgi:hypothetical protein
MRVFSNASNNFPMALLILKRLFQIYAQTDEKGTIIGKFCLKYNFLFLF